MKELRVFAIPCDDIFEGDSGEEISNDKFIDIAEKNGMVWTLEGFEHSFNDGWDSPSPDNNYIRFIEVEIK